MSWHPGAWPQLYYPILFCYLFVFVYFKGNNSIFVAYVNLKLSLRVCPSRKKKILKLSFVKSMKSLSGHCCNSLLCRGNWSAHANKLMKHWKLWMLRGNNWEAQTISTVSRYYQNLNKFLHKHYMVSFQHDYNTWIYFINFEGMHPRIDDLWYLCF